MNAIEMLETDHEKVKKLLATLDETTDRGIKTRTELLAKIRLELKVHETIEEQIFYPALANARETEDIVKEAYQEHHMANVVLDELSGLDPSDEMWGAKATVLRESVEHHIEEEEGELFPKARTILGSSGLEDLGAKMEELKAETLASPEDAPPPRVRG